MFWGARKGAALGTGGRGWEAARLAGDEREAFGAREKQLPAGRLQAHLLGGGVAARFPGFRVARAWPAKSNRLKSHQILRSALVVQQTLIILIIRIIRIGRSMPSWYNMGPKWGDENDSGSCAPSG